MAFLVEAAGGMAITAGDGEVSDVLDIVPSSIHQRTVCPRPAAINQPLLHLERHKATQWRKAITPI